MAGPDLVVLLLLAFRNATDRWGLPGVLWGVEQSIISLGENSQPHLHKMPQGNKSPKVQNTFKIFLKKHGRV